MCVFLKTRLHQETDLCMNNACFDYALSTPRLGWDVGCTSSPHHTAFYPWPVDPSGEPMGREDAMHESQPSLWKGGLGWIESLGRNPCDPSPSWCEFFRGWPTVCDKTSLGTLGWTRTGCWKRGGGCSWREERKPVTIAVLCPTKWKLVFFFFFILYFFHESKKNKPTKKLWDIHWKDIIFLWRKITDESSDMGIWCIDRALVSTLCPLPSLHVFIFNLTYCSLTTLDD